MKDTKFTKGEVRFRAFHVFGGLLRLAPLTSI